MYIQFDHSMITRDLLSHLRYHFNEFGIGYMGKLIAPIL